MKTALKTYKKEIIESLIFAREGEVKLGQRINCLTLSDIEGGKLSQHKAKFIIIGIPEDIGVRANFGKEGCADFFNHFLPTFLSIQSNSFLTGDEIAIGGEINCDELMMQASETDDVKKLSELVRKIDAKVEQVLYPVFSAGKIPIIIGGGHNNAYPILTALYASKKVKINVVNIDPHADLRNTERRHSGNGFSFALKENLLDNYCALGLHESYNNQYIIDHYSSNKNQLHFFSYDDYLRGKTTIGMWVDYLKANYKNKPCGLEIDSDSIAGMPCSASTPSGFTLDEVRRLSMKISEHLDIAYLHIPEAQVSHSNYNSAKAVSYLVSDFVKSSSRY